MAAKTTRASVEKVRKGIQERTGVTPTARHSEIPSLKSTANTEQVLRDLGQTDVARGSNTFSVEAAKSGSPITSGFVNAFADNPKLASAASFLAGSSVANDIFRQRQNQAMKGTLTNEMKSAGLTQEDIDTWNAEQNEKERQQVMSQWAKDHPIMTTLNAIPENAFGSIEGNINKAIDYVKGNPIQSKETNADIYRRSVSENINSGLGRGAYGVANSIGDMLFAAWLTGGLGGGGAAQGAKGLAKLLKGLPAAGVMGLEKSNQVMNDASERGLSNNQIAAEGLLSGASTAATEALPFSKFGEGGHIVGSMLAEGLQEGSEDILDTFFDELVTRVGGNGNKSDLSTRYRQYLSAGYNADEARKAVTTDYIKQVIMDTLAGGAAGGAMGGLGNFMGGRNVITGKIPSLNTEENVQTEAKTEEDIEAEDYLRSILEEANQMELHPENIRTEQNIPQVEQPEQSINVYRGFNRSTNPLESNLARQQELSNFIPNLASNQADAVPLSYYTENPDVAREYARQNLDLYNALGEESYRALTGDTEIPVEGEMKNYTINPQNVFDITELGEKVDSNTLYNYLKEKLGPEFEKAFPTADYFDPNVDTADEGSMYAYQLLRNSGAANTGDTGTRFYNLLKNLGYDAVRYAEQGTNQYAVFPDVQTNEVNTVQAQPEVEQPTIPSLTNRQLAQYTRQVEGLIDKLGMFGNKSFNKSLNNALNAVQNTQGEEQQNAIASLNNLVNQIDEQMAGSEVGVNQRTINQDMYDDMKRVTDGYVVKVNDNMLDEMGLTLKQLNDRVNTTARDGVNHIRFVKGNTGTPIDSVYNELYELSNHQLPDPRSMAEGDQLKAVYDYVTRAKAGKNEMAQTATWENVPVLENRTKAETDMESQTDAILDKIANGTVTDEDYANFQKLYEDIYWNNYDKPYINAITDMEQEVRQAYSKYLENVGLDEDIANLTEENVGQALGEELEKLNASHPFKLDLFAEKGGEEELPTLKNEVHTGNYKTSKFATNTFPNSGAMTESEYREVIPEDIKKYEAVTHEATLNAAEKNIKENGYTGEYNRLLKDGKWDAVDVDTAMMCAMREAENARNAEALGIDPAEAWGREVEIFKKARSQATAGGQMIEAFKKWSAMTPEGKLGQAIAHVNETVKEKKSKNNPESQKTSQKIPTAAERYLTDEFMAEFLKKAHQYDGQDVSLLKQARLNAELAHMVNEQIPVKFRQKFTSLWMDNLLASFRTLISRNFGGNVGKAALDQTLVKAISGPIDNFISRYTGTRTTTGFTKEGVKTYLKGFAKGAGQTVRDYWTPNADPDATFAKDILKGEKTLKDLAKEIDVFADANVTNRSGVNEESFNESLENNRVVFKNKAAKLYDKIIKFGLAIGDNPFYKGTYDQTVLELNTLREQGKLKLPEDITEEEYQTWVKAVATAQGLEAVYQENSELAEGASDIKKGLSKMSEGYVGFDFLSGASMPFVRTPMNVIKTNLELSPLGIVKNTVNTVREIRSNLEAGRSAFDTESFDQRRFVRETSRNIVGLLMFATGLMLKNAGMLTGGYSDDKREAQAQKDAGMQEYAWVSPFSGNQYSIDWLPGIGSSFISASAFDDAFNAPDQDFLDALINGAKAGSASMFEQAALQGLRRLTGADTVSSSSDNIIDNVVKTVANTASSAIVPAFVRQSAAALDPYKRNTYGMGGKESVLNNAIAGIPFLRQTLEPRIGLNGQPIEQNAGRNGLEKWFDNLVNPAMVTVPSALENPVRDEAMRLYNETKNYTAFQPKISLSYLNVDGHQATTEEYTRFLQIADSAMNQTANDFIQSDFYNSLSDEEKEASLGSIYSTIQNVERAKFLGLDTDFDGEKKAYYEGGSEGLINYIMATNALNSLGMDNNETNRQAVIQTINSYSGGLPAMMERYNSNVGRAGTDLDLLMNNQYSGLIETIGSWNSEAQIELRKEINSIIRGVEFNSMVGIDKQYDGARKAYAEGGVNGLAEYLFPATVLKSMGMDNNEKNREMIMTAYNEGGANAVRQQVQAAQAFASSPYGENLTYRYSHATNYLPSLNPSQFAQLYDAVDQQDKGTSGFNTITQQEVIDYLNQNPGAYDANTALQYWRALDQHGGDPDNEWKKIPVLVNGYWQAKKA